VYQAIEPLLLHEVAKNRHSSVNTSYKYASVLSISTIIYFNWDTRSLLSPHLYFTFNIILPSHHSFENQHEVW